MFINMVAQGGWQAEAGMRGYAKGFFRKEVKGELGAYLTSFLSHSLLESSDLLSPRTHNLCLLFACRRRKIGLEVFAAFFDSTIYLVAVALENGGFRRCFYCGGSHFPGYHCLQRIAFILSLVERR